MMEVGAWLHDVILILRLIKNQLIYSNLKKFLKLKKYKLLPFKKLSFYSIIINGLLKKALKLIILCLINSLIMNY